MSLLNSRPAEGPASIRQGTFPRPLSYRRTAYRGPQAAPPDGPGSGSSAGNPRVCTEPKPRAASNQQRPAP